MVYSAEHWKHLYSAVFIINKKAECSGKATRLVIGSKREKAFQYYHKALIANTSYATILAQLVIRASFLVVELQYLRPTHLQNQPVLLRFSVHRFPGNNWEILAIGQIVVLIHLSRKRLRKPFSNFQ